MQAFCAPRLPASPHTALPARDTSAPRRVTTCAHPVHHHWADHHPAGAGLLKEAAHVEATVGPSFQQPTFVLVKPCPSFFSADAAPTSHHKPAAGMPTSGTAPARQNTPAVNTNASPGAGSNWAHPYPENKKRWKVDEDAWYVPPEGWLEHAV